MGTSENSEGFSDWEEVRDPYGQQSPSSHPDEQSLEFQMVLKENYYSDGSPVFPPTEHEGLPLLPVDCKSSEEEDSLSVASLPVVDSDTDDSRHDQMKQDSNISVVISKVKGRFLKVFATKFRFKISSMKRGSVLVPGALLAVALFACFKFLQWKNRVLNLIREKDQRISQLLSQVAQMNEILSARRKVPILRIN
ncbi:uncharacterized protein LOC141602355 [Silene latifolia]|uniref:uncharacterized protein LOC141602355 n=1 Tax=Silene latifolia TaxID=37657 RepID=UPI003D76E657